MTSSSATSRPSLMFGGLLAVVKNGVPITMDASKGAVTGWKNSEFGMRS